MENNTEVQLTWLNIIIMLGSVPIMGPCIMLPMMPPPPVFPLPKNPCPIMSPPPVLLTWSEINKKKMLVRKHFAFPCNVFVH